jgi:hypothetical protein
MGKKLSVINKVKRKKKKRFKKDCEVGTSEPAYITFSD